MGACAYSGVPGWNLEQSHGPPMKQFSSRNDVVDVVEVVVLVVVVVISEPGAAVVLGLGSSAAAARKRLRTAIRRCCMFACL